jgi:hypothetical protein
LLALKLKRPRNKRLPTLSIFVLTIFIVPELAILPLTSISGETGTAGWNHNGPLPLFFGAMALIV